MLVSGRNVANYLYSVDVCSAITRVEELASLRSRIFVINDALFLKNFKFNDPFNLKKFKNEVAVLQGKIPAGDNIHPRFVFADAYFPVLITEYLKEFSAKVNASDLQMIFPAIREHLWDVPHKEFKRDFPWICNIELLQQRFPELTPQLLKGVYSLKNRFEFNAVIHGDLKFDNVLTDGKSCRLVDWEFCSLGDRVWDCAYLLSSLLLADEDYSFFCDSITYNNAEWFFTINEHKLAYIRDAFLFLKMAEKQVNKFIGFLGLAIVQRLLESKTGEEVYNHYDYFISLGQELILRPQTLRRWIA